MFGLHPDGSERPAQQELVRLAMPRRVYTQSHADWVVETIVAVHERREKLQGMRIVLNKGAEASHCEVRAA